MQPEIAVVLGSKSDLAELQEGINLLKELKITYKVDIISAHRNPEKLRSYCLQIEKEGVKVIIACAGMAAALPGFIASYVNIPVLGVAMKGGALDGLDALLSITSIPKGLGLAATGIGTSAFINAAIMALEILSLQDKDMQPILQSLKDKFR